MRNEPKHYTAKEKVGILRRHPLDQVAISSWQELISAHGVPPPAQGILRKRNYRAPKVSEKSDQELIGA